MTAPSDRYADLYALIGRKRLDRDVLDELEHHFDELVDDALRDGLSEQEARARALEKFGSVERARAATTAVDRRSHRRLEVSESLHDFGRAVRQAARGLRRRPEFSVFALLTLTVALGAFSALFTVLDRLVVSPLGYDEADRLAYFDSPVPGVGPDAAWGLSVAGYFDILDNVESLESLGAYSLGGANVTSEAGPDRVQSARVSATMMRTLRLRPAAGRLFAAEDDIPNGPSVALLSHGFWQTRFGADPGVLGRTLELNGFPYEIIGVLDEGHGLPDTRAEIWTPLQLDRSARAVNAHWVRAIGRLADGASIDRLEADVDRRTAGWVDLFPNAYSDSFMEESGFSTRVMPLKDQVLGGVGRTIWILFGAAGLLLVIALANITNLYLVRTEARRQDFEVRAALGASGRHLTWHCITETVLLAGLAGLLAIPVAQGGISLLRSAAPPGLPRLSELGVGGTTVAFTLLVALLVGMGLGLVPLAYRVIGRHAHIAGATGTRTTASLKRQRARRFMLAGQVALALVLLAAGGLMLRSLTELRSTEPGFDPEGVLAFDLFIPYGTYSDYEAVGQFYRELLDRLEGLPGVERAAATTRLPIEDAGYCSAVFVEDVPAESQTAPPCLPTSLATPGFFETLDIPVDGVTPGWTDMMDGSGPVVVTEALAARMWPGESAIGKGLRGNGWAQPFYRVVGVARDFRSDGLDRAPIEGIYFPMYPIEGAPLWSPPNAMRVAVETSGDPIAVAPAVRALLAEMDPDVPFANPRDYREAVWSSPSVARTSFSLILLGIAAGLALLLSTIGMYGVVSQLVVERSNEIAVRIAMGARLREVVSMVMTQSIRVALLGAAVGVVGALAATRALRSVLYEVEPTDPLTFTLATVTLLATVAVATFLAARRAGRVDPIETLRSD
ncbi:MAG: ABC transporter permease [Gemmatimonadota bacterium]|nr:ABC transporter permease [Gemmatimonadota bacterium]